MLEILLTISVAGLIAGWIFSIPGGGPITVLTTANALKGRKHFCLSVAIGGALVDWFWAFVTIFGFTKVFKPGSPVLPYLFVVGGVFLVYMGLITAKKKIDLGQFKQRKFISPKRRNIELRKGLATGFMSALLNPSLALSWLGSTFLTMTFLAFLGFNVAGIDNSLDGIRNQLNNKEVHKIFLGEKATQPLERTPRIAPGQDVVVLEIQPHEPKQSLSTWFMLLVALCYGFFVAIGRILWFYPMALVIIKYRTRLKLTTANNFLKVLGGFLCFIGLCLAVTGVKLFV